MSQLAQPGRLLWAEGSWEEARQVVLGLPYDGTASYHAGARFAPLSIREASQSLEYFSPEEGRSVDPVVVHDLGDVPMRFGRPEPFLAEAEEVLAGIDQAGKFPMVLGGEHGVSLAVVRALRRRREELFVLQFDAHADYRMEYLGERYSHATVMYRVAELVGHDHVWQLGIRSADEAEWRAARQLRPTLDVAEALAAIGTAPLYLSVDIDVLDPSVAPGTGTPEPGGVSFRELLQALRTVVASASVVGLDIVEVCPPRDPSGITSLAAAKLLRELTVALQAKEGSARRAP